MGLYRLTRYSIGRSGENRTTFIVEGESAEAVCLAANPHVDFASFTALTPQHGRGEAWTDNAHGQYDRHGLHGVYAVRA